MPYTIDLNKLALKFNEPCCFVIQEDNKYRVWINNVYFKIEKDIKIKYHVPIFGLGFTIADASNDFFRKARTGFLYHSLSDQIETAI